VIEKQLIQIAATEMRVAVWRKHFDDALFDANDGNVKSSAAEIVHQSVLVLFASLP